MFESDSTEKLLHYAVGVLARRAHSRGELEEKLLAKAKVEEVRVVLSRLEELNLLNDERYAYNFALWRMQQDGWGPAKALHFLLRRRVEAPLARSAVERVRHELGDTTLIQDYLNKHWNRRAAPNDRQSIQKLISRLQRRGFQEETIYSALRQIIPAAAWQRFERGD